MTNYPTSQDNTITLPGVSGISQEDIAIEALREATFAIELELGIVPSGVYPDVRARLDILESRINLSVPPAAFNNDGYIISPLYLFNTLTPLLLSISDGYGAPTESRINGSLYMRADGYANNDFYIRRDGYWVPIQTEAFVAAGDLMGNHLSQTVIGLYGKPLRPDMATVGATQDGYQLTWNNSDGYWGYESGFLARNDLAPAVGSGPTHGTNTGRTAQTVVGFQNRTFASTAPVGTNATDGSSIRWNVVQTQWEPQAAPVIFTGSVNINDGYTTRANISSNKAQQSPTNATGSKVGMVNFGSRSTGLTTGTTDSYAAILSGDQHTASGQYTVIAGGLTNSASALYAAVLGGTTNIATQQSATVLNGSNHTASGFQSLIGDGYSHIASGSRAFVINGGNNTAAGDFSGVLGGISHTITAGATHAGIGWGSLNSISAAGIYSIILGGSGNQASAQNIFIGPAANANVQANYASVHSGLNHIIGTTSIYGTIINGTTNTISAATPAGFIGTGNNNTVTLGNATILNGNTNVANGLYATVINGANNQITGGVSYSIILDGYNHLITAAGGFVGDGYGHTISGLYSTILNGNTNSLASRNSTILNGSSNTVDATSAECTILSGTANSITGTTNALVSGNGNILLNSNNSYVLGTFNNIQSTSSKVIGSLNVIAAGGTLNRVLGNSNTLGASSNMNNVFGQSNSLGPVNSTHDNTVIGSSNIVDGYGNSVVLGSTNMAQANFSLVEGQYGRARLFGQHVHANSRFNAGQIGNAQFSRVVLQGNSNSGAAIPLLLQDTAPVSPTLVDGYSYDMQIRVLVVNTSPISPNPVVPARFIFNVLAHQEPSFTTTIAAGSNGVNLNTNPGVINVASTASFPTSGSLFVNTASGYQLVTYTGTSGGNQFTGVVGGTGVMSTGGGVTSVGLVLDNIDQTIITTNTSDDPTGATRTVGWSVTISNFNATTVNQLLITVDPELDATNYVRPSGTPSNRRAVATIEMLEMTRL